MAEVLTDPESGLPVQVMGTVGGAETEPSKPAETPSTTETPPAQATETPPPAQPDTQQPQAAPEGGQEQPPVAPPSPTEVAPAAVPTAPAPDLAALGELITTKVTEGVEAATKGIQSSSDRRVSALERSNKDAESRHLELRKDYQELKMAGLSDEEKAQMRTQLSQEDRGAELQKWEDDLTNGNREFNITTLLVEHKDYVTEEDLAAISDVEKLETFCLEKQVAFLEAKISGGTAPQAPSTEPAPTAPPAPSQPQVPAGVGAASDVGGSGTAPQGTKFIDESTPEAMESNYRNTPWEEAKVAAPRR